MTKFLEKKKDQEEEDETLRYRIRFYLWFKVEILHLHISQRNELLLFFVWRILCQQSDTTKTISYCYCSLLLFRLHSVNSVRRMSLIELIRLNVGRNNILLHSQKRPIRMEIVRRLKLKFKWSDEWAKEKANSKGTKETENKANEEELIEQIVFELFTFFIRVLLIITLKSCLWFDQRRVFF